MYNRWRQSSGSFDVSNLLRQLVSFGNAVDYVFFVLQHAEPEINLQLGRYGPAARPETLLAWQLEIQEKQINRPELEQNLYGFCETRTLVYSVSYEQL